YLTNSDYYSWQQRSAFNDVVFDGIDQLASQAQNKTEFEKTKFLFDTIIDNTDYAYDSQNQPSTELKAHSVLGYFSGQNVVCEGYAKTLQILFNTLGIENCYVTGYAGEDHAWNYVNLFGEWYLIDATWSDTSVDNDVFLVNEFDNVADTYQPNDSTMSIKYQYQLPALSKEPFALVSLHKDDQFVGNFGSVDSALKAFDNEKADYTIYLYDTQTNESYFSWKISDWFNSYSAVLVSAHEISGANSVAIVGTNQQNAQKADMPYVFFGNDLVLKTDLVFKKVLFTRAMVGNTVFGDNVIDLAQQTMTFDNCIGDVFSPINGGNGSQIVYKNIKGHTLSDGITQNSVINVDTIVIDNADIVFENDIKANKLVANDAGYARIHNSYQKELMDFGYADGVIDVDISLLDLYATAGLKINSSMKYMINIYITDVVTDGFHKNITLNFSHLDYYPKVTFKNNVKGEIWFCISGYNKFHLIDIITGTTTVEETYVNPYLHQGAFFNFKKFAESDMEILIQEKEHGIMSTQYFKVEQNGDIVSDVKISGDFVLQGSTLARYLGDDLILTIPEGITGIADSAIVEKNMVSIILPSTIKTLNGQFVRNCPNLVEIVNNSSLSNSEIESHLTGVLPSFKQVVNKQTIFESNEFLFTQTDGKYYLIKYTGKKAEVVLPKSTEVAQLNGQAYSIATHAFAYNENLVSVTISESISEIGELAFLGCYNLQSISIPASVTKIGSFIVRECFNLSQIVVDQNNANYTSANSNCIVDKKTQTLIAGCNTTVIPEGVKHIADYSLMETGITKLVLPKSIETLGIGSFIRCFDLSDVYFYGSAQQFYAMAEQSSILDFMQNLYVYDNGNWVKAN
ncbi:MAG: leucine-rich repeat protein, partial [Clostridia bacterium]|nr:leucine-rich repeat protein [Clostridia bacterium]